MAKVSLEDKKRWIFQVFGDPDLELTDKIVAAIIAEHLDRSTGISHPSRATIASIGLIAKRTVATSIRWLHVNGHLNWSSRGRDNMNAYQIVFFDGEKVQSIAPSDQAEKMQRIAPSKVQPDAPSKSADGAKSDARWCNEEGSMVQLDAHHRTKRTKRTEEEAESKEKTEKPIADQLSNDIPTEQSASLQNDDIHLQSPLSSKSTLIAKIVEQGKSDLGITYTANDVGALLDQGCTEDDIVESFKAAKKAGTTSFGYVKAAAFGKRNDRLIGKRTTNGHAKPPVSADDPFEAQVRAMLAVYKPGKFWPSTLGAPPDDVDCSIDPKLLREYGFR